MFAVPAIETPLQQIYYRDLSLASMIEMQKAFAAEISDFFTTLFKSWTDNSKPFPQYDLLIHLPKARFFTINVRKAVIAIAYLLRREFWRIFQNKKHWIKYCGNDQNYFSGFTVCNNHCLLQFLAWVAYLFELTTYSFSENQDYLKQCVWCLENYTNIFKFHVDGGWQGLNEFSVHFSSFYDLLNTFTSGNYPESDIFVPFSKALRIVERHRGYENEMLQITVESDLQSAINKKASKFLALLQYDPKQIRLGHISVMKAICHDKLKYSEELPHKAAELLSICETRSDTEPRKQENTSCKMNFERAIFCPPATMDNKTPNALDMSMDALKSEQRKVKNPGNVSPEFNYMNSIFVVSDRFLEKRQCIVSDAEKMKCKRDITIYSPMEKREIRVENLKEILDENIDRLNILEIEDGIHVVCPPELDNESKKWIISLNTSSEEDDNDSLDIFQQCFMKYTVKELKESKDFNDFSITMMKMLVDEVLKNEIFAPNSEYDRSGLPQKDTFTRDKKRVKKRIQQKQGNKIESIQNLNYEADSEDSQKGNPWRIRESRTLRKIKRIRKTRNMPRLRKRYTAYFQKVSSDQ